MNAALWIVRWVVALGLAVAAGLKIGGNPGMQTVFGELPKAAQWAAIAVELGLAAWLVSGTLPRVAAFSAITLFSVFMAVILVDMNSPVPKDCGCLGKLASGVELTTKLRLSLGVDVALLLMALALYYLGGGAGSQKSAYSSEA